MLRLFLTALARLGLAMAATTSVAHAADRPKVGYLGADGKTLSADAQAAVDEGATAGLQAAETIQAVGIPRSLLVRSASGRLCASEQCVAAVARSTGVQYLLRIDAKQLAATDYAVTFDLIRVSPFAVVFTSSDTCSGCIPTKLSRRTELNASAIAAQLVESLESPAEVKKVAASPTPENKVQTPPRESSRAWLPWVAGGTAVVALAGGVIAWRADNSGSCSLDSGKSQCPRVYSTKALSAGLFGVAALGAAVTAWSLIEWKTASGREIAVSTSGMNISLTGKF